MDFLGLLGLGIDASPAVKGAGEFEAAAGKATRAGEKATDAAEKWTKSNERVGRSVGAMASVVRNVLVGAIAAYSATIGIAIFQSGRFETGLIGVGKTANLQGRELTALGQQIDRLSRTNLPNTTSDLLAIAQSAGQLGVTGAENILAFTETIAKLGASSDLAGEEGATALARILNVTGEATSTVGTLASVIVDLGNNFAASESQIARHTGEVARATAVYEIGSAKAAAIATTLAAFGVQAELSGSAVGRSFRTIESAVKSGGDELRELSAVSKVSADELKAAWERGPVEAFRLLLSGIRETSREGGNVAAALDRIGLSGEEVLKVIPVIAKELDTLDRALGIASEQTANATALDREFAAAMSSAENQVSLLKNEAAAFVRVIGDQMLPVFVEVVTGTKSWLAENRELATSIGSLGASIASTLGDGLRLAAENIELVKAAAAALISVQLVGWLQSLVTLLPVLTLRIQASLAAISPWTIAIAAAAAATQLLISDIQRWGRESDIATGKMISASARVAQSAADTRAAIASQDLDQMAARYEAVQERMENLRGAQSGLREEVGKAEISHRQYVAVLGEGDPRIAAATDRLNEARASLVENSSETRRLATESAALEDAIGRVAIVAPEAGEALSKIPPPSSDVERLKEFASTIGRIREELEDQSAIARIIREWGVGLETATDVVRLMRESGGLITESRALEYVQALAAASALAAQAAADHVAEMEAMVDEAIALGQASRNIDISISTDDLTASAGAAVDAMFDFGDIPKAKAKESADAFTRAYDNAAQDVSYLIAGMFGDILRGGNVTWGDLWYSFVDTAINAFEQIVQEWIAAKLKMEAFDAATGSGGGGGVNAGQAGSLASGSGASAATLGIIAVFAAAAYAWYNERQHTYAFLTESIQDLGDSMQQVADKIGESISGGGRVEVRKDGDRFRIRSGTDAGVAEYKYFEQYADAIAGATLDRLRMLLDQGELDHIGEQAKLVIGNITDGVIQMGERGMEWLQRGLDLATELDNLGQSGMELELKGLRYEYDQNIKLAAEYGLSLEKVGDLYRSQLSDIETSLRDRIAQYLPGYDPVGNEFSSIRADNEALKAEYERQRAALQAHIEQILKTIAGLENGITGGGGGGIGIEFNRIFEGLRDLLDGFQTGNGANLLVGINTTVEEWLVELDTMGETISRGTGISPDVADRIALQRERLADLLREMGLLGQALTDEEIAAAEQEARRRTNRGNRSQERAAYTSSLESIVDSGLPDLVRELKATQDQIADVAAEAARLGVDGGLAAAALAALNAQLASQVQDAYLTLAERMAEAAGDEQTLRDLAELRWDLERAQMLIQIDMLEEMGFLQADQIERLRGLYANLPEDAPGAGTGDDPTADPLEGLGVDIGPLLDAYAAMQRLASIVDVLTNGTKVLIPGLAELVEKLAKLDDEARAFVGDSLFLQFGDQLLSFIDRYYGDTKEGDQLRIALEQVRFQLEIANLNAQFQMLQALGVLTDQQISIITGALAYINNEDNWPDFTIPDRRDFRNGDSGSSAAEDRARDLERFLEALQRWEQIGLSDARRELMDLTEEFDELRATAIRLHQPLSRVNAAFEGAMEDFWDRMLGPYEDRGQDANQRLADLNAHFQELIDLAGEYGGDLERILAAQQSAVADLWEEILGPLRDYQSQLAGSTLGSATPEERLLAAQQDFQRLADAALAGDVNAIQQLPAAIERLLQEAQGYYGTGAAYQALYSSIQGIIDQILGLGGVGAVPGDGTTGLPGGGTRPGDGGGYEGQGNFANVTSFATRQPLVPQIQPQQQGGDQQAVALLKEQLEESRRINREQARLMTEMAMEMRRNREAVEAMAYELRITGQATRRTNTVLEDEARTSKTRRGAA